jgi:hypothetical protein
MIRKSVLMGSAFAAVFALVMTLGPATADGDGLSITKPSFDEFSMIVDGTPGQTTDGHAIVVYAFFTDTDGKADNSFKAYVAAVHPSFQDDNEQNKDITVVHAHALELDKDTLCVSGLAKNPTATIDGNEVTVNGGNGNIIANVIAGYDITAGGICPTEVYDLVS